MRDDWTSVDTETTVILFDGACNLCSRSVRFVIARDPHAHFRFAAIQGEAARRICAERDIPASTNEPNSIIVIAQDRVLERSDAVLAIAARLSFPWSLLRVLRAIPRPLREWLYRLIAMNRVRWFGRSASCMMPTPELRERFLD